MILRQLTMQYFRRFKEKTVEFKPGLNVVRGPNESGKSTIHDAIVTILWGDPTSNSQDWPKKIHWQAAPGQHLKCTGQVEVGETTHIIEKDFANKAAFIQQTEPAEILADNHKKVKDYLENTWNIGSEKTYMATACINQRELAELKAGKDISDLLQQKLTGGDDDANVKKALSIVKNALEELSRPRAKTGTLDNAQQQFADGINKLENEIKPVVADVTRAQQELATTLAELEEVQGKFNIKAALWQTVSRRFELKSEYEKKEQDCKKLQERINKAKDLQQELNKVEEDLAKYNNITPQSIKELGELKSNLEQAQKALTETRSSREKQQNALEIAQEVEKKARAKLPDDATLEQAESLSGEIREQNANLTQLQAQHDDIKEQRDKAQSRRKGMGILAAVLGVGAVVLGVVAALGSETWAVLGAIILGVGAVGTAIAAFRERVPDDSQALGALQAVQNELAEKSSELEQLCRPWGCTTVDELTAQTRQASKDVGEKSAKVNQIKGALETLETQLKKHEEKSAEFQQSLQKTLADLGYADIAAFNADVASWQQMQVKLSSITNTLNGHLGDDTLEALQESFNTINSDRYAQQEQLQTPKMQAADMSPEEFQALQTTKDELEKHIQEHTRKKTNAENTIQYAMYSLNDQTEAEAHIAQLKEQVKLLENKKEALEIAQEVLQEANAQVTGTALETLEPNFIALLQKLTCNRYQEATIDPNTLKIAVNSAEKGDDADPEKDLSLATREQVYLAMRLALADVFWSNGCPPLLLDDPLVHFDEARRLAALEVLKQYAQKRQVILFTAQDIYDAHAAHVVVLAPAGNSAGLSA